MTRPRIGFVTCVHPLYDLPAVMAWRETAVSELRKSGCEVTAAEVPRTPAEAIAIAGRMADVDLVALFFCSWVSEEVTLALARELKDIPLLLWALPYLDLDLPMPSPITGITASAANIRRIGKPFAHVIGGVVPAILAQVVRAARAGAAVRALRRVRLGVVGDACPGMLDVAVDERELEDGLGVTTLHFELEELVQASQSASTATTQSAARRLEGATGGRREVSEPALLDNLRLYVGIERIVRTNQLDAYCVRCWPELRDGLGVTPCTAHALMAEDGIPSTCEVDVTALITTWLLSRLGGSPAFNFDITAYLEEQGAIQFAHCGAAAPSLAAEPGKALVRVHMRTATGATVEFPFREGQVTLAKLLRPANGKLELFAAIGNVIASGEGIRGSVATVVPQPSAEAFLSTMIRKGVEHHIALVYGDCMRELELCCQFTGVEYAPL